MAWSANAKNKKMQFGENCNVFSVCGDELMSDPKRKNEHIKQIVKLYYEYAHEYCFHNTSLTSSFFESSHP